MEIRVIFVAKYTGLMGSFPSIQINVSGGTDDNGFENKVFFSAKDHNFLQMQLGPYSPRVEKFSMVLLIGSKESNPQAVALLI